MIRFLPIASSSKGNAYIVADDGVGSLLLEAGLPISKLREKIGFNLSSLAGCLISHEHGDHSKAVKDLLRTGVDCWMSHGTALALGFDVSEHHRTSFLFPGGNQKIGAWTVLPFTLVHDAAEPLGFLISHSDDRLLFIPDTEYVENRFESVTTIAIECNNIEDILSDNIVNGAIPAVVGRRVRRNHMSLDTVKNFLRANDLSKLRSLYLLHLSDSNSDELRMKKEIQELVGVPVYVC